MAQQTLSVHKSKLTYATLKKMLNIVDSYKNVKSNLTYYFPEIVGNDSEGKILRRNCVTFIENSLNGTGVSPSNSSPDYIRSGTSQQLNSDTIVHIYNRLSDIVTLGDTSVIDYSKRETGTNILSKFIQIMNLEDEYTMHRQIFNGVKDEEEDITDNYVDKDPGQLSLYSECEMPIPVNSKTPDNANFDAFIDILGDDNYFSNLPVYDLNGVSRNVNQRFYYKVNKVTVDSSPYTHNATIGCVITAKTPGGDYLTNITYDNKNTINISGIVNDTEVRILELYGEGEEGEGLEPLVPEVTSPQNLETIFRPLTIECASLQISGGYFDLHTGTSWQISDISDFSNIIGESLKDRNNLTSITLEPSGYLNLSDSYYTRVKQNGSVYGETDGSSGVMFYTPTSWLCEVGNQTNGGMLAGSVNEKCIVVAKYEAEPSSTNNFEVVSSETTQLSNTYSIGDMVYRDDVNLYYVNETGSNNDLTDGIEIDPQEEPNYDIFVDSESEMLSLTVSRGNIAIRTDENKCYVNKNGSNTSMSDWLEIDVPVKIGGLAKQYCKNLSYNGYDDWYMPTSSELNQIQNSMLTIDTEDETGSFNAGYYWSSTVDVLDDKYYAGVEDFDDGSHTTRDRDKNWYYVRPVRRL